MANPLLLGLEPPIRRKARGPEDLGLPAGIRIVSADDHWDVVDDVFFERFPEALQPMAPRVFHDQTWKLGFDDGSGRPKMPIPVTPEFQKVLNMSSGLAGSGDLEVRLRDMDQEGFDASILFPQLLLGFIHAPHLGMREHLFRIYNEYLVERCSRAPNRLFGVGVLSNWWDENRAADAVQQIVDLGLKTFMLPLDPGKGPDDLPLAYSEPFFDKMWSAIEASELPVCFHIGENPVVRGRGAWGINALSTIQPFSRPFAQLVYGGIFDRCPNLKVVFCEGGFGWVPAMLQDAEAIYDNYIEAHTPLPRHRPSHYWHKNCWATFMNDPFGLRNIDAVGRDRVMWACDYPHAEGTYSYSWQSRKTVVDAVGADHAAMILGGTAERLFNLS